MIGYKIKIKIDPIPIEVLYKIKNKYISAKTFSDLLPDYDEGVCKALIANKCDPFQIQSHFSHQLKPITGYWFPIPKNLNEKGFDWNYIFEKSIIPRINLIDKMLEYYEKRN